MKIGNNLVSVGLSALGAMFGAMFGAPPEQTSARRVLKRADPPHIVEYYKARAEAKRERKCYVRLHQMIRQSYGRFAHHPITPVLNIDLATGSDSTCIHNVTP